MEISLQDRKFYLAYFRTQMRASQLMLESNMLANQKQLPIFVPFGIGCGLAGGDWDRVTDIINFAAPNCILVRE